MEKKLYRSAQNRVFAGVCGGIGEYFDIDPVLIRLLWVFAIFWLGGGVLAYLLAMIIVPSQN